MMYYKDHSYCTWSNQCKAECDRRLTEEDEANATERRLDVSYFDCRDTAECPGFEAIDLTD